MQSHAQTTALFLLAGQSNAVGQGDSSSSVTCSPATAYEYKEASDNLVPLADPVGENAVAFQRANTGSVAPAFAKTYHELSGQKIVIVSAARGGSSCHVKAELDHMGTWATQGKLQLMAPAIQKTKSALRKTGSSLNGILWLQGERDANAINAQQLTTQEYKDALLSVISRFREAFGEVPFYIVLTGYYKDHPLEGFDAVRAVQEEVSRQLKKVYVVYRDTDQFEKKGWMKDAIHYNQAALNAVGEASATAIFKIQRSIQP